MFLAPPDFSTLDKQREKSPLIFYTLCGAPKKSKLLCLQDDDHENTYQRSSRGTTIRFLLQMLANFHQECCNALS
jgi:hypothetical protein